MAQNVHYARYLSLSAKVGQEIQGNTNNIVEVISSGKSEANKPAVAKTSVNIS